MSETLQLEISESYLTLLLLLMNLSLLPVKQLYYILELRVHTIRPYCYYGYFDCCCPIVQSRLDFAISNLQRVSLQYQ